MILKREFFIVSALILSACSVNTEGLDAAFAPKADDRVLPQNEGKLSGNLNGQSWKMGNAVAHYRNGDYSISISSEGNELTCANPIPSNRPYLLFDVPNATGTHSYDGSASGRLVNFVFPSNGSAGPLNVLASKSRIDIVSIAGGFIQGSLAALSPQDSSQTYSAAGSFAAKVCNGPAAALQIQHRGSPAFQIVHAEAVKITNTNYEVRVMDKVPRQKCNAWNAWMMTESPIKYFVVRVQPNLGDFLVEKSTAEYGSQGASSGWSTEHFEGTGRVLSVNSQNIRLSLAARDPHNLVTAEGEITVTLCEQ